MDSYYCEWWAGGHHSRALRAHTDAEMAEVRTGYVLERVTLRKGHNREPGGTLVGFKCDDGKEWTGDWFPGIGNWIARSSNGSWTVDIHVRDWGRQIRKAKALLPAELTATDILRGANGQQQHFIDGAFRKLGLGNYTDGSRVLQSLVNKDVVRLDREQRCLFVRTARNVGWADRPFPMTTGVFTELDDAMWHGAHPTEENPTRLRVWWQVLGWEVRVGRPKRDGPKPKLPLKNRL